MRDHFAVGLLVGGFLLASWVDAKVGDSRPTTLVRRMGHAVAGVALLQLSVGALYLVQAAGAPESLLMLSVFVVFLPMLVYALLAGLWVIRAAAELTGIAR